MIKRVNLIKCILVAVFMIFAAVICSMEQLSSAVVNDKAHMARTPSKSVLNIDGVIKSKALKTDWNYSIYLPQGYYTNKTTYYPIIYLLHGSNGDYTDYQCKMNVKSKLDSLIKSGKLPKCIVVFPNGFESYYIDSAEFKMETAFMKELIPNLESKYRVIKKKNARVIGGLSMGGYGALRFSLINPKMFGNVILMSPAIWNVPPENSSATVWPIFGNPFSRSKWKKLNWTSYYNSYKQKKSPINFFVATGKDDTLVTVNTPKSFVDQVKKDKGSVKFLVLPGGHDWNLWNKALLKGLEYIGSKMTKPIVE